MAVQIVWDVPSTGAAGRVLRGIGVVLGMILVIAGLVAATLPLLYVLIVVSDLIEGRQPSALEANDLRILGIFGASMIVGLWVGLRLIRGRRRLGLYLRKFGFGESTRTVTAALTTAVGRSVRLVTLDDAMVSPLGVSRSRRRLAWWVWALTFALVVWGLYWAFGGGYDQASQAADEIADPGESFSAGLGAIFALLVVLVGVSLAGGFAIFGGAAYLAARRAERASTRVIDNAWAIASTARTIASRSRQILSPRLVVVRVATTLWQNAVQGLANVADVVVIDVSHPTDALLWEVATMKPQFGNRWVLVGAQDSVTSLAHPQTAHGGDHRGLLARQLDGEQIIAYGPRPADQQRFARALRRRLYQVHRH
jgi:hypothetical protein